MRPMRPRQCPETQGHAPFFRREFAGDNGHAHRHQHPGAHALDDPEENKRVGVPGQGAEQ